MVEYWQSFLLAIIQGITEWLPVSSSAHLALAQQLLGISPPVFFDIMLHIGTLIAVIIYFRNDLFTLVRGFFTFNPKNEQFRYCIMIVVASIPTAIIGFAFHDFFGAMFSDMFAIAIALTITGIAIYSSSVFCTQHKEYKTQDPKHKTADIRQLSAPIAFLIGVAQGIAVAPGISRSGFTISAGLFAGLDKEVAARFSFILSIPALIGAAIFEFRVLGSGAWEAVAGPALFGTAVAAIVGYFSISFLLDIIKKGSFAVFAYYCWLVALFILLFSLL